MNPYEILDISPGASADEIKAAYHQMAKQWHPDRFSGDAKPEAEQRFRMLAEAFNMLKDTGRRESSETSPQAPAAEAPAMPPQIELGSSSERAPQSKSVDEWFMEAKAALEAKSYDRSMGLIQYAIRLNPERGEFHALFGKLLGLSNGDKRMEVRSLETAVRLNPKDVESTVLLAQAFQTLGMHARASRLWSVVHNLEPGHAIFKAPVKKVEGHDRKAKAADQLQTWKEQLSVAVAEAKEAINRLLKRG